MSDRNSLASSPPREEASLRRRRWRLLVIAGGIGLAVLATVAVAAFALSGGFDKKVFKTQEVFKSPARQGDRISHERAVLPRFS